MYGGSVVFSAPFFGLRWSDLRSVLKRLDEDFVDIFWSRMALANQIPLHLPRGFDDVQRQITGNDALIIKYNKAASR